MDEDSGSDLYDASGNDHTGKVNGPTISLGKFGNARNFDIDSATNDYIEIPSSPDLNLSSAGTISMWVRKKSTKSYFQVYLSKGDSDQYSIKDAAWDGNVVFNWGKSNANSRSNTEVPTGSWQHIVIVYDGIHRAIYVNGILRNSVIASGTIYTGGSVKIGSYRNTNYLNASIDEIAIFNRSLSESEIKSIYYNQK